MSSPEKPDEREKLLRFYLGVLKGDAGRCSNEANKILQHHVRFASLMAQRIDDASESQCNLRYDDSETARLANDISKAADLLSADVTKTKHTLDKFVSVLEEVKATVEKEPSPGKEPSLLKRFLRLLKNLFQAIARFLASVVSWVRGKPRGEKWEGGIPPSTLEEAAATLCTGDPGTFLEHIILPCKDRSDRPFDAEPQEGKQSESPDSVILFLKNIVPREAQNAQRILGEFDAALDIMGLERHMRGDRRVTLYGDLSAVARKWRDVAEQYQSELLDNEDPAFDRKKSWVYCYTKLLQRFC